jgi:hypothetical protein
MAAELKDRGVLTAEIDCWVLGQLLIGPTDEGYLAGDWYETKHVYVDSPKPPNDNYEDEGYQKALEAHYAAIDLEEAQRATEVMEALRRLTGRGLVGKTFDGKYFADLEAWQAPRWPDLC